jgi:hypothetical protein
VAGRQFTQRKISHLILDYRAFQGTRAKRARRGRAIYGSRIRSAARLCALCALGNLRLTENRGLGIDTEYFSAVQSHAHYVFTWVLVSVPYR